MALPEIAMHLRYGSGLWTGNSSKGAIAVSVVWAEEVVYSVPSKRRSGSRACHLSAKRYPAVISPFIAFVGGGSQVGLLLLVRHCIPLLCLLLVTPSVVEIGSRILDQLMAFSVSHSAQSRYTSLLTHIQIAIVMSPRLAFLYLGLSGAW